MRAQGFHTDSWQNDDSGDHQMSRSGFEGPLGCRPARTELTKGSVPSANSKRKADRCLGVPRTPRTSPFSNAMCGSGLLKTLSRRMTFTMEAPVLSRMSACAELRPFNREVSDTVNHSTSSDLNAFRNRSSSCESACCDWRGRYNSLRTESVRS